MWRTATFGNSRRESSDRMMAEFNFSVLTPVSATSLDSSVLVTTFQSMLRESGTEQRWTATAAGAWYTVTPTHTDRRDQGWKLHISATIKSAEQVLRRSLPVLLRSGSAFKFAATLDHVALLNSRNTPRGHSGKFLTIYPDSDAEAVRLAEALHRATEGLTGPRILSDRTYQVDSLVHYRYGAFAEQRQLSHDGFYSWVISDPNGDPVEDRRTGQYTPPEWASCPFPDQTPRQTGGQSRETDGGHPANDQAASDQGVLIGNRFLVKNAVRQTNRGGVYRAFDNHSDAEAVIKEARPHVGTGTDGRDERDRLRAEAGTLEILAPHMITPRVLAIFEQARHLFLAEELIPGLPLQQWIPARARESGWRQETPQALTMAIRVVELMNQAHRAGLVLRDFNPNNIMVLPEGELRLIDLELATFAGAAEAPLRVGTLGFSAPEQLDGAAPAFSADYYSLGATLCFLALGTVPTLLDDDPVADPPEPRIAEWLAVRWETAELPDQLRKLILRLMDVDADRRPSASHARGALDALSRRPVRGPAAAESRLPDGDWKRDVDGVVGHLLNTMTPAEQRLWPVSCAHGSPDPCSVQHGAAGVLGVLTRGVELGVAADDELHSAIETTAEWITSRLRSDTGRPPGLYFGEAGISWSLYEAGSAIGSDQLVAAALELAHRLPDSATNPDITHGTAGIAVTLLHLWRRTGDEGLLCKAGCAADALLAGAEDGPDGLNWGTPAEHLSQLAGRRYYGFAHGNAGVAYSLLAAALATGRSDYLDVARRVGKALLDRAIVIGDMCLWGAGTGDEPTAPHWCHGSSGIGTFLVRLYRATGDEEFNRYAEMAARAVAANAARSTLAQCHGLAGNGEFLLDMADATGEQRYELAAHRMARLAHTCRAVRNGRVVFPSEHGELTAAWGDGMTGMLGFLLRLRHRCARMWMVDELLDRGAPA